MKEKKQEIVDGVTGEWTTYDNKGKPYKVTKR